MNSTPAASSRFIVGTDTVAAAANLKPAPGLLSLLIQTVEARKSHSCKLLNA
jgi:hypothetical protein